jgi:hypothetical protein
MPQRDAAAIAYPDTAYLFIGSQVVAVSSTTMQASAPQPIGTVWPDLPASFKLGVVGAVGLLQSPGELMLFNGGRYATTNNSMPIGKLTSLTGWPQTTDWADGIIDTVCHNPLGKCILIRKGEAIGVDLLQMRVDSGPVPLNQMINPQLLPASWTTGFDAAIFADSPAHSHGGALENPSDPTLRPARSEASTRGQLPCPAAIARQNAAAAKAEGAPTAGQGGCPLVPGSSRRGRGFRFSMPPPCCAQRSLTAS